MNLGTIWGRFVEKTGGQKYRANVPLIAIFLLNMTMMLMPPWPDNEDGWAWGARSSGPHPGSGQRFWTPPPPPAPYGSSNVHIQCVKSSNCFTAVSLTIAPYIYLSVHGNREYRNGSKRRPHRSLALHVHICISTVRKELPSCCTDLSKKQRNISFSILNKLLKKFFL